MLPPPSGRPLPRAASAGQLADDGLSGRLLLPGSAFHVEVGRPAEEPPYEVVCNGLLEYFKGRDVLLMQVVGAPGAIDLPVSDRQRTLMDFEELLARVVHQRYLLPDSDQVTAAVWARASIGAIRTALGVLAGTRTADDLPRSAFAEAIRACFAVLPGTRALGDPAEQADSRPCLVV